MSITKKECRSLLSVYKAYLHRCTQTEYNFIDSFLLPSANDLHVFSTEINTVIAGLTFCGNYKPKIYKDIFKKIKKQNKISIHYDINNVKVLLDPKINRESHNNHLACFYLQTRLNNALSVDKEIITRILKHNNCDQKYHTIRTEKCVE